MNTKIKLSLGIIGVLAIAAVSFKFVDISDATIVKCSNDAKSIGGKCVCNDPEAIYQYGACIKDPVNLCPPDAKRSWSTCVCNDKNLVYENKVCKISLSVECNNAWGVFANWFCDFSKNFWSAPIVENNTNAVIEEIKTQEVMINEPQTLSLEDGSSANSKIYTLDEIKAKLAVEEAAKNTNTNNNSSILWDVAWLLSQDESTNNVEKTNTASQKLKNANQNIDGLSNYINV